MYCWREVSDDEWWTIVYNSFEFDVLSQHSIFMTFRIIGTIVTAKD